MRVLVACRYSAWVRDAFRAPVDLRAYVDNRARTAYTQWLGQQFPKEVSDAR